MAKRPSCCSICDCQGHNSRYCKFLPQQDDATGNKDHDQTTDIPAQNLMKICEKGENNTDHG